MEGVSMLYKHFLEEEYIKNIYKGVEGNERIPISHGMPHILNVIGYCTKFAELFNLDERDKETLLLSALMHDVAQVFLQPNHAKNGEIIVKEMLENNESIDPEYIKSKVDIERVAKIVGNHGGKKEEEYEDFLSGILIVSDKLDITKDRIRPRYKKYDFLWFMDYIEKVDLELDNTNINVIIKTNKDITFEQLNNKHGLDKLPKVLDMFCKKHNFTYQIIVKKIEFIEQIYNKLVRDNIPEIIRKNKGIPYTRILSNEEYKEELEKKLFEECNEVKNAEGSETKIEELADVLEIVCSIAKLEQKSLDDVIKVMKDKREKRGGFEKKIFLEKVNE